MTNRYGQFATALTLLLATASAGGAQGAQQHTRPMKEEKAGLLAQAKVAPDAARKIALARVPSGRIKSEEIEVEDGKLAYSFDIAVSGKPGVEEILVDAKTGAVISQSHETPEQEAAETKKAEKKPERR